MGEDEELPRDAKLVKSILRSMGVEHHEPRVVNQFLDLWYRYVVDVLGDAQTYSEHAGKTAIDCDDVKLAIQSRVNFSFSQPPPRETLVELAKARNSIPLPKIIGSPGIALPPELDTLIAPNYQLAVPTRTFPEMEEDETERKGDAKNSKDKATAAKDVVSGPTQPTHLQKSDQDGHKVSFSLAGKRPKS
ncbi:unnamed protein product [Sphagnum troendelagicum]|jgi:transcription initiation factor TFIID subunit 9B|uniref:Transcription initiation factor TFIID subunit 9 n=1 Tax=Sphagnum troendelagicum TaxID=128251 RepID=A0ABP0UHM2_9BRYO